MSWKNLLASMLRRQTLDNLKTISVSEFSSGLREGGCQVIDVRNPEEYAAAHVEGAKLSPLDGFDASEVLVAGDDSDHTIYVLCKAGGRAQKAAELLAPVTQKNICVVSGGTDACIEAGLAINRR